MRRAWDVARTASVNGSGWWKTFPSRPTPCSALASMLLPIRLPYSVAPSRLYSSASSSSDRMGEETLRDYKERRDRSLHGGGGRGRVTGRKVEELRAWRRQLLLRVHPDLFQASQHAHARAVNQRSLQAFQALTALAGHAPSSSSSPLPSTADEALPLFSFHFFLRPTPDDVDDAAGTAATQRPATYPKGEEPLREVQYEFRPPPDVRRNPARLRRAAEECMLQLFSLAGLIRLTAPSAEQQLRTQDGWVMTDWNENALREKAIEAIRYVYRLSLIYLSIYLSPPLFY
jgi:hypothetical protein